MNLLWSDEGKMVGIRGKHQLSVGGEGYKHFTISRNGDGGGFNLLISFSQLDMLYQFGVILVYQNSDSSAPAVREARTRSGVLRLWKKETLDRPRHREDFDDNTTLACSYHVVCNDPFPWAGFIISTAPQGVCCRRPTEQSFPDYDQEHHYKVSFHSIMLNDLYLLRLLIC